MKIEKIFNSFPDLETENLLLRRVHLHKDVSLIQDLINDEDCVKYYFDNPDHDASAYCYNCYQGFVERKFVTWIIVEKKSNRPIGIRDLFFDSEESPVVIQGALLKGFRQKGYTTEAYNKIFSWLRDMGIYEISVSTEASNYASLRLLYNLGFKYESHLIHRASIFKPNRTFRLHLVRNIQHPIESSAFPLLDISKDLSLFLSMFFRVEKIRVKKVNNVFEINFMEDLIDLNSKRIITILTNGRVIANPLDTSKQYRIDKGDTLIWAHAMCIEQCSDLVVPGSATYEYWNNLGY